MVYRGAYYRFMHKKRAHIRRSFWRYLLNSEDEAGFTVPLF